MQLTTPVSLAILCTSSLVVAVPMSDITVTINVHQDGLPAERYRECDTDSECRVGGGHCEKPGGYCVYPHLDGIVKVNTDSFNFMDGGCHNSNGECGF
ncbi:hypothetical protein C8R44DRAFT_785901 [Mycena epipterygia]|nr:hypothetical protein C8R44DRAFT_785901 [Mycena epipterygia]